LWRTSNYYQARYFLRRGGRRSNPPFQHQLFRGAVLVTLAMRH
jgi:hypothetical protein